MSTLAALVLAGPWVLAPVVTLIRIRKSRSLVEYPAAAPRGVPLISIVIPARNEARNIERCVRSALASEYPALEVIAVDDHSSDGTGELLAAIAREDARLRVVVPAPLPAGWFGKQWACAAGFELSSSSIIGFLDADTEMSSDLVSRVVQAMLARDADMLTVAGRQELVGFWEKLLQPQVFSMMAMRYGSTEAVNDSPRESDKIANGQCLFVQRDAYVALGGHASVREKVAEDMALAQGFFRAGRRGIVVLGLEQLSTRMYTSLAEIVHGWGKNIYAGGREAMPGGVVGRVLYPLALSLPALMQVVPLVVVLAWGLGAAGVSMATWAAAIVVTNLLWWLMVYGWLRLPIWYVLLYPLGALVFLYIALFSIVRGNRVRWKGRDYVSA